MRSGIQFIFILVLIATGAVPAVAGEVLVAVASSMSFPVGEIIEEFERTTPHTVRLTLGSSGNFHSQILNGAPFDVYMSADMDYVRRLDEAGLVESGSLYVYAIGKIVLWFPVGTTVDVEAMEMTALLDPAIERISIPNPVHAPYGRAAIQAMESSGIFDRVRPKLVIGENASQAAQFVRSGAAQVAILPLSLASADPMRPGQSWEIPRNTYSSLEQGMAILSAARRSGHIEAANAFLETVQSPRGRSILLKYGFSLP